MGEFDDLDPGQAVMVDWTAEEYHADTETESRSELWMLHQDPPRYFATVVENSMMWPESKEMEFGSLLHLAVLEWEAFKADVRWKPNKPAGRWPSNADREARRTAVMLGTAEPDEWMLYERMASVVEQHEYHGGRVISAAEANRVTSIAHAVHSHEYSANLLRLPGSNEQTVIWREPTTGLLCRVRWDMLRHLDGAVVIGDLKSTRTPEPQAFGRSIEKLGYDFQGAFYSDAARALFPGREVIFAIIAAGTEPVGHRYQVSAAPLADRAIHRGRRKYKAALADLVKRRKTNNWRATWEEDRALVFDMPRWAYPRKTDDR